MDSVTEMPPNESRAHILINTVIAFLVLDCSCVALRFWSRRLQWKKSRPDDYFVVAALIVIIGTCITSIYSVKEGGVGRHLQYVPKDQRIRWLKSVFIAAASLYTLSSTLPKLAIISIYLGIFQDKISRSCCWVVACILAVGPVIFVPIITLQCTPMAFLWNKSIPEGHCVNQALMFRYGTLSNIITDVVMLVLPMPLIWKLHVSMKVKMGLLVTFLLGSIGLITSILRFVAFFTPLDDGTWAAVPLLCWVNIESSMYLLAACFLTLKPLLRYLVYESSMSRLIARSWSRANNSHQGTLPTYRSDGTIIRLPSDDREINKSTLRHLEFSTDRWSDNNGTFAPYSVPRTHE